VSSVSRADWRTPTVVLICGGMILTLGMGIRHGFGLFLQPMSADLHWGRETFALAIAVQNLVWGATQPFAGMVADKYGSGRVLVAGTLLYVLGLASMAHATTPLMMVLTAGVLIGVGLSGVTFSVVSGVLGRAYPPEKRSMALGISAAAGSFGQFAMLPLTQWLLAHVGVTALALIGLFNIFGTYTTGWLGGRISKKYILSAIYFGRSVVIALFLLLPLSPLSVYLFAAALGLLWLSTVPPTNGIVAQVFGVRYLAMLSGFTFFSHQIGSFLGAWLGGFVFDRIGSYDVVWYLSIALGIVAGLLNLPIDEREIDRGSAKRAIA
jgi:MFS family permease